VVTVVDAIAAAAALDRFPEATKQVAMADVLIVAKTDLVDTYSDPKAFADLKARVQRLNPRARTHETVRGAIDPELCFGPRHEDVEAVFAQLSAEAHLDASCGGHAQHDYRGAGIDSFAIELTQPLDGEQFNEFLTGLAADFGQHLLRTKGILYVCGAPEKPAVIHGVQHIFFPVSWLERWPTDERCSRIVFITQNLAPDVIRDRFKARFT
jgi:G3E family GTPase